MGRIEKTIEIKASPEKIWKMLALDRALEWGRMGEWKSVEYISDVNNPEDKYRVGTTAHITEQREEFDIEITESIENKKITSRLFNFSRLGNANVTETYLLEPSETGTKVSIVNEYPTRGGIFGKALDKLFIQRYTEKQAEKSLENLKNIMEQ